MTDENIALRNKIGELKERLNQIYSQSAVDASKRKVFETEFSLYLKACEHARDERMEGFRLQHDVTKFGLAILAFVLAVTAYVFIWHILLGTLALLVFGVVSCGFMCLLLAGEMRIVRAGQYCLELEAYFRHRWSSEEPQAADLPGIPLWEEYRSRWGKDLVADGPYGKTAVYAPFRIMMTLTDLAAFLYLVYSEVAHVSDVSRIVMITAFAAWVLAVSVQMLCVNAIISKVGKRLAWEGRPEEYRKKEIGRQRGTWSTLLELFLALDIFFPPKTKKGAD